MRPRDGIWFNLLALFAGGRLALSDNPITANVSDSERTSCRVRLVPTTDIGQLFDHLVDAGEQGRRNFDTERLAGLEGWLASGPEGATYRMLRQHL
jgi:hypothetical protein